MNASQRARRRARRSEARERARRDSLAPALDYSSVFSMRSLVDSSTTCQGGVLWKGSVQSFCLRRTSNCAKLKDELDSGSYKKKPATRFVLRERGCERSISGVSFRDRVVQRTLCDSSLVPLLCHGIIDDNCASIKGRGMHRARIRFAKQMIAAQKRWGGDAVCVQYDFRHYFASIDSRRASECVLREYMRAATDGNRADARRIHAVADQIITEERGVGLGNQTSQTVAIWWASPIDHYVREVLRCGLSGRYMDDGYVFCRSSEAASVLESVRVKAAGLGLELHPRKSRITPLSKPLAFLKVVYRMDGGHVRVSMCSKSLCRTMRHLAHVRHLVDAGRMPEEDYVQSLASTYGNICRLASPKQRRRFEASVPGKYADVLELERIRALNGVSLSKSR